MKLVIRAEIPPTLEKIREPVLRMLDKQVRIRKNCQQARNRIIQLAEPYRRYFQSEEWVREEAALADLLSVWPLENKDLSLYVQKLPVPSDLPLPLLDLLTGLAIAEEKKWPQDAFSPFAMLWLREAGAQPLHMLSGKILRMEHKDGVAVMHVGETGMEAEIPVVIEQKNHEAEHIDEGMLLMQVNIDDSSPEWLAYVMEQCFRAGANDVHFLPVTMKKSRPGTLLQVMCYRSQAEALKTILFQETTTFGIRYFPVACHRLARRFVTVYTVWGEVAVKLGYHRGTRVQISPEYADCARAAEGAGVPLKVVYQQAIALAAEQSSVNLL
jgi:hypothetical protein